MIVMIWDKNHNISWQVQEIVYFFTSPEKSYLPVRAQMSVRGRQPSVWNEIYHWRSFTDDYWIILFVILLQPQKNIPQHK